MLRFLVIYSQGKRSNSGRTTSMLVCEKPYTVPPTQKVSMVTPQLPQDLKYHWLLFPRVMTTPTPQPRESEGAGLLTVKGVRQNHLPPEIYMDSAIKNSINTQLLYTKTMPVPRVLLLCANLNPTMLWL